MSTNQGDTSSSLDNNIKMDVSSSCSSATDTTSQSLQQQQQLIFVGDVISRLYPNVNQKETPLPRQWSTTHKFQTLSLSHNNLRVTYKGPGKNHKDAASVRTDNPIPSTCGIYYFEIKIISKGRDGYMGIGMSKSDVMLNRLPGWDKNSYGYHGDDGHSFCCSGTGQNYGPTFTTNDIIGCCLNSIENTCFYTKNGYNLGIAFRDLPGDLHPTVGLQTPAESVEANFGQYPFEFDIYNYVKEWHLKTRTSIERFQMRKDQENSMPIVLRKLISTYLVHHGYSSTAEAFAKSVDHVFEEELASIRDRQRIQKAITNGQISEAIELTKQLFPGILDRNPNLLFSLKIRQFIEMVNGCDSEITLIPSYSNGKSNSNGSDVGDDMKQDEEVMEVVHDEDTRLESPTQQEVSLQKILKFGRELFSLSIQTEHLNNELNQKMLRDAFSLLAYHDPWSSPVGYILDASQREPISAMLNSAILEANNMPRIPPLEVVYGQTSECLRLMSKHGIAWSAYVNLTDYMQS